MGRPNSTTIKKALPAVSAGLIAAITFAGATVQAVPLAPGATVALGGTTVAAHPYLAGTVVEDVMRPFSLHWAATGRVINGQVQDRVVKESTGDIDFYYRIEMDQNYQTSKLTLARSEFPKNLNTDVDYRTDGLGVAAPSSATRGPGGLVIATTFLNFQITPGSVGSTRFVFVHTAARVYHPGGPAEITTADGGHATFTLFQPGLP